MLLLAGLGSDGSKQFFHVAAEGFLASGGMACHNDFIFINPYPQPLVRHEKATYSARHIRMQPIQTTQTPGSLLTCKPV